MMNPVNIIKFHVADYISDTAEDFCQLTWITLPNIHHIIYFKTSGTFIKILNIIAHSIFYAIKYCKGLIERQCTSFIIYAVKEIYILDVDFFSDMGLFFSLQK